MQRTTQLTVVCSNLVLAVMMLFKGILETGRAAGEKGLLKGDAVE